MLRNAIRRSFRAHSHNHNKVVDNTIQDFKEIYDLNKKKILGKGASAIVYEATDKRSGATVAVKCIRTKYVNRSGFHYLKREIESLLRLNHPNVLKIIGVYEGPHDLYIVTEKIEGGELFDEIVSREGFSERDCANIVRQLAEGLRHCHEHGVVHRDLKPENIMYDPSTESIKILDFGYSATLEEFGPNHGLSTTVGTEGYWAPEVLIGKGYDSRCDNWSLGVIMYCMLSGYHPFLAVDKPMRKNRQAIKKGEYYFHEACWDPISVEAREIIVRLLQVDPNKRISLTELLQQPWVDRGAPKTMLKVQGQLSELSLMDTEEEGSQFFDELINEQELKCEQLDDDVISEAEVVNEDDDEEEL